MANTIKKESEVTKVTTLGDTDYVRVTLANGQSGSIKKSDLMPIIKDELGKLLGNADALSTFTNVLVNNGQTLGKATIENLASVVSGGNELFYDVGPINESDLDFITKSCISNIKNEPYSLVVSFESGRAILQFKISGLGLYVRIRRDYAAVPWSKWASIIGFSY